MIGSGFGFGSCGGMMTLTFLGNAADGTGSFSFGFLAVFFFAFFGSPYHPEGHII
jgi:hypothetical protein